MKLTKEESQYLELIKAKIIKEQSNRDTEAAHCNVDDYICDLLVELGMDDIVEEFNKVDKWYA